MTTIEDLRRRVEAAETNFGLLDEQQRRYSERLISVIATIEAKLGESQTEIHRLTAAVARGNTDNEQLRGMLHSLLQAVESGNRDRIGSTLRDLDARLTALVGSASPAGNTDGEDPATAKSEDEPAEIESEAADTEDDELSFAEPLELDDDEGTTVVAADPELEELLFAPPDKPETTAADPELEELLFAPPDKPGATAAKRLHVKDIMQRVSEMSAELTDEVIGHEDEPEMDSLVTPGKAAVAS